MSTLTSYEPYDKLIQTVVEARKSRKYNEDDFSSDLINSDSGWVINDIDEDNQPELLFGKTMKNGDSVIFGIYTLSDNECIQLANGWYRNRYYICNDGSIINSWSGSSFEYGYSRYLYSSNSLYFDEAVDYIEDSADVSGNGQWYYSRTSEDLLVEDSNGKHILNPAFTLITEDEAESIINSYEFKSFNFTPFE